MFLECNVKPIVVFDGGYDKSGRKLKTVFERVNQRLSLVKGIARNKSYYEQVLPILARDVFICVLNELSVPFAICDYEADDQITALANYYKCPVISADSDFFIFDVHNGFITRDSIETTVILDIDSSGKEYRYLNCYIYYIDEFISCFPGIEKTVLPLFGTLMGNDYVERKEFDNFFANIQLPKYKGKYFKVFAKQKKMIGLLCWLKNNSLSDAINQILQYLKKERREYVKSIIESAVTSYDLYKCNLLHIINQKLSNSKNEFLFDSRLTTACGNSLPLDFIIKYHSGHYTSFFANVIVLHKLFLSPQIDDLSSCSSHMCARNIRKIIYGILIRHDVDADVCQNEKCLAPIEEYDRHENRLKKELVEPVFFLDGIGMLPKINELSKLEKEKAKLILMKVLEMDLDFIADLPIEWQLFVGSIKYWLCNSIQHSTEAFLYALIVNLIYCDIIRHNNPYQNITECCSQSTKINRVCSSVLCILSKIRESDFQHAAKNLKKYLSKPSINHGNPLRLNILHSYSQLQSCVTSVISLNKLLGAFMKNPNIERCLNGSLLYNLTRDISMRSNPKLFIAEILGRETTLSTLFTLLESKIYFAVPSDCILKNVPTSRKKTSSKKKSSKHVDTAQKSEECNSDTFDILDFDLDCDILI